MLLLVVAIVDVISMAVVEVCRSWSEVRRQGRLMEESGRSHVRGSCPLTKIRRVSEPWSPQKKARRVPNELFGSALESRSIEESVTEGVASVARRLNSGRVTWMELRTRCFPVLRRGPLSDGAGFFLLIMTLQRTGDALKDTDPHSVSTQHISGVLHRRRIHS